MATYEQDIVMFDTKENGDKTIKMPISRVNNIEGIGRSINTAYLVNDVVYVDNNKKVALKCTTAGTTSSSELDVSSASIGSTITDGTVKWQVCNRTSDVTSVNGKTGDVVVDLPVGHTYWSVEHNVPAGRLPAMGATYNRALYADLWAWANSVGLVKTESEWQAIASANDGNCAYYSSGDGSSTFRVPSIKCWVKGASSVDEVGSYLEAGLPNITGSLGAVTYQREYSSGALQGTYVPAGVLQGGGGLKNLDVTLDASRSNSIYGNSDTVQPPSIVGQWLIVAFGVAHNIGEADVANVMQAVETAQTSVQVVDNKITGISDYIIESYRNGTEWYRVWKSGWIEQGGYIVASTGGAYAHTVTLLKPFSDNKYQIYKCFSTNNSTDVAGFADNGFGTQNPASFTIQVHSTRYMNYVYWVAEGQGA